MGDSSVILNCGEETTKKNMTELFVSNFSFIDT